MIDYKIKHLVKEICNPNLHVYLRFIKPNWITMYEKFQDTEFFLFRIFPHSDWIRKDMEYLSVLRPNTRKYGPKKPPYLSTFYVV